jgi:serine/threonine protein kinase
LRKRKKKMGIDFSIGERIRNYTITSELLSHGNFAMSYFAEDTAGTPLFFKEYIEPTSVRSWYRGFIRYQEKLHSILKNLPGQIVESGVEFFEERNLYFQVFQRINGTSLRKLMKESVHTPGAFPDSLRWDSAKLFMYAISVLHSHSIVHCDLKPENAFMEDVPGLGIGKRIKIIDFDFSFIKGDPPPWVPRDAKEGKPGYLGTPNYLSPEHLTGKEPSTASDMFTCGIILYEILCGTYPLSGYKDLKDYLLKFANKEFSPPHALNTDIRTVLSGLMVRMLDMDQSKRPSAKEVHKELLSPTKGGPEFIKLMIGSTGNYKPIEESATLGQRDFRAFDNYRYIQSSQFTITRDRENGIWFIEGCTGVKNNTRLNGTVITGKKEELHNGDIISVGPFKTEVKW